MARAVGAKGKQRRREIVDAAVSLLLERGLDGFVLREVAAAVGITLGNLQYYFPSRDDLLEAVICDHFERDLAVLGAPGAAVETAAVRLVRGWLGDAGAVFLCLNALAAHHDRFSRLHHDIYARFLSALDEVIAEADPTASDAERRRRARVITALLDGVALQLRPPGGPGRVQRRQAIDDAARLAARIATGAVGLGGS